MAAERPVDQLEAIGKLAELDQLVVIKAQKVSDAEVRPRVSRALGEALISQNAALRRFRFGSAVFKAAISYFANSNVRSSE